jgi:hypothetical protein
MCESLERTNGFNSIQNEINKCYLNFQVTILARSLLNPKM